MEAISSSETSVETQRTTKRHIPEDDNLHFHMFGVDLILVSPCSMILDLNVAIEYECSVLTVFTLKWSTA
jgi:hypothetical protein